MSLRTQKSVVNGLGIDLPLPIYKASVTLPKRRTEPGSAVRAFGFALPLGCKGRVFSKSEIRLKNATSCHDSAKCCHASEKNIVACLSVFRFANRKAFLPACQFTCLPVSLLALVPACRHAGIQALERGNAKEHKPAKQRNYWKAMEECAKMSTRLHLAQVKKSSSCL